MTERKTAAKTPPKATPAPEKPQDPMEVMAGFMKDLSAKVGGLVDRMDAFEAGGQAPRDRGADTRSRANDDTRVLERAPMDAYSPPQQLEVPVDDQYDFRWVAEWVNGQQTPRNVQLRLKEGYERVKRDVLPEDFVVDEDIKGDGNARTGGLILMKIPKARKALRTEFYQKEALSRQSSADVLQGVAGANAVREDRGSRTLDGGDAASALMKMSQS